MASALPARLLLALLAVTAGVFDARLDSPAASTGRGGQGDNVILVVSDGLRWQEVFRGADAALTADAKVMGPNADIVRRQFWRPTVAERRAALMPFVWGTIARHGALLGNRDVASQMFVANGLKFSYPGYSEMLTGYPDPRINSNDVGPNPNVTVFEWINGRAGFRDRVAAVGAWSTFADIFNARRSRLPIHASRAEPLDANAHAAAMRFLQKRKPRALFIAYVETDDNAHKGRYDLTLAAAHAVDRNLAALWGHLQSTPQYRGRTTLIFTADHGRGATSRDWTDHGQDVAGAEQTWMAIIGPNTPALGEVVNSRNGTAQIAATVAGALGLDYRAATPRAAVAIEQLVRRAARAGN
jgi:hypothetical protein